MFKLISNYLILMVISINCPEIKLNSYIVQHNLQSIAYTNFIFYNFFLFIILVMNKDFFRIYYLDELNNYIIYENENDQNTTHFCL